MATMIRWTLHHPAVFFLTFSSYALIHVVRKTLSFVKGNIIAEWTPAAPASDSHSPSSSSSSPSALSRSWTRPSLFEDQNSAEAFLGMLDAVFLFVYSVALYISGMLADRVNLRLMLSAGMFLSALTIFACGPVLEWTSQAGGRAWPGLQAVYVTLMVLNGVFQSTGWPCVVAVMGNWFGRNSRGFIMGVWSASPSVGSIIGALMAAAVLDCGYEHAFVVTSSTLIAGSVVVFFGMVTSPLEVGLPMPDEDNDDDDNEKDDEEAKMAGNDGEESEEAAEGADNDSKKYDDRRRRQSVPNMLYTPGWVSFAPEPARARRKSVVSVSVLQLPDGAKRRPSLPVGVYSSVWTNGSAEANGVEGRRKAGRRYSVFDTFVRRLSSAMPVVIPEESGPSQTRDDRSLIPGRGESLGVSADDAVDDEHSLEDDEEEEERVRRKGVRAEHDGDVAGCDNFAFDTAADRVVADNFNHADDDKVKNWVMNRPVHRERKKAVAYNARDAVRIADNITMETSAGDGVLANFNRKTNDQVGEEAERVKGEARTNFLHRKQHLSTENSKSNRECDSDESTDEENEARTNFTHGKRVSLKNNEGHSKCDSDKSTGDNTSISSFGHGGENGGVINRRMRLERASARADRLTDKRPCSEGNESNSYTKTYDSAKPNGTEKTATSDSSRAASSTSRLRFDTEGSMKDAPNDCQVFIEMTNLGTERNNNNTSDDDKEDQQEEDISHIAESVTQTNGPRFSRTRISTTGAQHDGQVIIDVTKLDSGISSANNDENDDNRANNDDKDDNGIIESVADTTTNSNDNNNNKKARPKAISFFRALLLPGVIPYSLAYACLKMVNYVFFFWLPFYLSSAYGWPQASADRLSIWYDVGGVVSGTVAGVLANRFQKKALVVAPMLVLAVPALYIYGKIGSSDMVTNSVMLATLGAFIGGVANIISAAISADLGRQDVVRGSVEALSTVTGIIEGTGTLGAAMGQVAVPYMNAAFGWLSVFYFLMAAISLTVVNILPIVVAEVKEMVRSRREMSNS